jgi:hypothetical protein
MTFLAPFFVEALPLLNLHWSAKLFFLRVNWSAKLNSLHQKISLRTRTTYICREGATRTTANVQHNLVVQSNYLCDDEVPYIVESLAKEQN